MLIGAGGGIVGCEGVTLLPPGSRWLTLALSCLQIDTREIENDFDDEDLLNGTGRNSRYCYSTLLSSDYLFLCLFSSIFFYHSLSTAHTLYVSLSLSFPPFPNPPHSLSLSLSLSFSSKKSSNSAGNSLPVVDYPVSEGKKQKKK